MNWRNLAFLAVVGFGAWQYWSDRPVKVAPGVTVSADINRRRESEIRASLEAQRAKGVGQPLPN